MGVENPVASWDLPSDELTGDPMTHNMWIEDPQPIPNTPGEYIRSVALAAASRTHAAATPSEIIAVAAVFETYLKHGHVPNDEGGGGR